MSARSDSGPVIVPATTELVTAFWGATRYPTMRAIAAVLDGRPICIAGVYFDGNKMCAFADISDEMRRYRKAGLRMGRRLIEIAVEIGTDIYALADSRCPGSDRFLAHIGFRRAFPDKQPELFVWQI